MEGNAAHPVEHQEHRRGIQPPFRPRTKALTVSWVSNPPLARERCSMVPSRLSFKIFEANVRQRAPVNWKTPYKASREPESMFGRDVFVTLFKPIKMA